MSCDWLDSAVFYEVYPTSFYDSNADGIGDIPGIIEKLPYIAQLGCTAIWLNPCFCSSFRDGRYDCLLQNAEFDGQTLTCSGASFAVFYRNKA